ncbi:hypothetical protein DPSP01_008280 [Paraphaeosphaeria sporulosa]
MFYPVEVLLHFPAMVTVGSGQEARRFTEARTNQIIDLQTYERKAAVDEKRWTTSHTKFEAQNPPPAYYHASPMMRLPTEIRLQILAEVLFDPDEITFNFNVPDPSALFLDALKQHAVQLPSTYAKSYSEYSFQALLILRLAPQWKNQIFVELQQNDPGTPRKRSNARKLYTDFHGDSLHRREACLDCYVHCRCWENHSAQCTRNRANGQLLRVCKAMYYDALPLLYNLNVFAFENAYEMGAALHAMGPGRQFIRYVDVRSQLFHGGVLWEYLLPCRMIRQLYFPESHRYIMKQDGKRVEVDTDRAPEFFGGWMIRGGEAFFDMVRQREKGENDPLEILEWHGGCKDVEANQAADRALRARLPVQGVKKKIADSPTSMSCGWYLPVFAKPGPMPREEAVEYYVWKDGPLGPEKTRAPSTLSKACCRLYNATLLLWTSAQAIRRKLVQAKDELKVELRRFKALITIRNVVALPWLFIRGSAYTIYGACAVVVCFPGCFVGGTLFLVIPAVYLLVQSVRETVNFLTVHILKILPKITTPSEGKRHMNGNGHR